MAKKLKAGDRCDACAGTGTACTACMSPLDECECEDRCEPGTCELCDGHGFIDEFTADCTNALAKVK